MKTVKIIFILASFFSCSSLFAQNANHAVQMEVFRTFNSFMEAMRDRDTTAVKKFILYPSATNHFFHQSGFTEKGAFTSSASVGGFMNDLSNPEGLTGKCRYDMKDVSIEIFDRYAIVSAKYKCFTANDQLDNCGKYTVRFLKTDQWKIEQLYRYVIKDRCTEIGLN